jgi:hypothetical protein
MMADVSMREQSRAGVLAAMGARGAVRDELLAYNRNHFQAPHLRWAAFPLPDEPFVAEWNEYAGEVARAGTLAVLERYLVQLRFPIEAGMSANPVYIAAGRRGADAPAHNGVAAALHSPETGHVRIYETPAGRIPAIVAGAREDFVALVRAFTARNEPVEVPASMGACVVTGYNNWNRIRRLRGAWIEKNGAAGWTGEFARVRANRELYQDTFLILSTGPYSAVAGSSLGIDEPSWLHLSVALRAEHEAAHYFTRRVLGSMRTALIDELIADFYAVTRVFGSFHALTALHFLGLEAFPDYRAGGRLENYRGAAPRLSDDAFKVLQSLVHAAVLNLEMFARGTDLTPEPASAAALLCALCQLTVEELASSSAPGFLADKFGRLRRSFTETRAASELPLAAATATSKG